MKLPDNKNSVWYSFIRENAKRYATHIPHGMYSGISIVPSSDNMLYSFANCQKRQSTKYGIVTNGYPDLALPVQSTEIYHKNVGIIPNYLGYIPGAIFRIEECINPEIYGIKSQDLRMRNWILTMSPRKKEDSGIEKSKDLSIKKAHF